MGKVSRFIGKWRHLSWSGKLTFLKAACALSLIKLGLVILPFATFRKLFHRLTVTNRFSEQSPQEIAQAAWSVDTAANLLPFELLCLPRALATKYLLRKVPFVTLEIGIEVNPDKPFEAHAWIEKDGQIIIGNWPDRISYKRIWVWE